MQKKQEYNAVSKQELWKVVSPIDSVLPKSALSEKCTYSQTPYFALGRRHERANLREGLPTGG